MYSSATSDDKYGAGVSSFKRRSLEAAGVGYDRIMSTSKYLFRRFVELSVSYILAREILTEKRADRTRVLANRRVR